MLRWMVGGLIVLAALGPSAPARAASRQKECADACAPLVTACGTTCGVFGFQEKSCRRAVLRRCRKEGVVACTTPTTTIRRSVTTTTRTTSTTTSTLPPMGDDCRRPFPLVLGTNSGDTSFASDSAGASCIPGPDTLDQVWTFTAPASGTLTLTVTTDWDAVLHVRTTCDDSGTEVACEDKFGGGTPEVRDVAVTAGTTYFVWVDAYNSDAYGSYSLTAQLQ